MNARNYRCLTSAVANPGFSQGWGKLNPLFFFNFLSRFYIFTIFYLILFFFLVFLLFIFPYSIRHFGNNYTHTGLSLSAESIFPSLRLEVSTFCNNYSFIDWPAPSIRSRPHWNSATTPTPTPMSYYSSGAPVSDSVYFSFLGGFHHVWRS